jgi:hypothetical protein
MAACLNPNLSASPCIAGIEPAKSQASCHFGRWESLQGGSVLTLLGGFAVLISAFCAIRASAADALSAGFIYDQFPLTLAPGHRTEAAGPFFYKEQKETEETLAFPPIFSYAKDPAVESQEFDFVYPVVTYTRFGGQYRLQFFQLLSFAGGRTQTEDYRNRLTLYPIYFQQRSSDPSQNYTALVPFYGHLQHRMFHDEIFFVMFPFYAKTRKKDMITENYVYPFVHVRYGPGLTGWQFWPFYGEEHKDLTTKTNIWGDAEQIPGYDHHFVVWPFYYDERDSLGTENPMHNQALIPFYAFTRSPQRDSTTLLWPFFSKVDDREKKYREWDFPWMFWVIARGEGKTMTRFWPIFSHAHTPTLVDNFYLWPIYKYDAIHSAPLERERTRIAFFLFNDIKEKNTETGQTRRQTDLFPLFAHRRELNGNTRFQVLAVLEPFLRGSHKIERDYAPIYSLWRTERNAETGASSQSLLWNLYRRDAAPERKKVSVLFGLYQYRSSAEGKQVRLFYIPIKNQHRLAGTSARQ